MARKKQAPLSDSDETPGQLPVTPLSTLSIARSAAHDLVSSFASLQSIQQRPLQVNSDNTTEIWRSLTTYWLEDRRRAKDAVCPVLDRLAACRRPLPWGVLWQASATAGLIWTANEIERTVVNTDAAPVLDLIATCAPTCLNWENFPRCFAAGSVVDAALDERANDMVELQDGTAITTGEWKCSPFGAPGMDFYWALMGKPEFQDAIKAVDYSMLHFNLIQALDFDFTKAAAEVDYEFARAITAQGERPELIHEKIIPPRITIKGQVVFLDGIEVDLNLTQERKKDVLLFLQALSREWQSSPEIYKIQPELTNIRLDLLRKKLPEKLQEGIETDRRKGSRLK